LVGLLTVTVSGGDISAFYIVRSNWHNVKVGGSSNIESYCTISANTGNIITIKNIDSGKHTINLSLMYISNP
jgi:hypothetical protein